MTQVKPYTEPPSYAVGIAESVGRAGSMERAKPLAPNEHRVVVGVSGYNGSYVEPSSTIWRPWTAVTFTDLWLETNLPTTGLSVALLVNGLTVATVTHGTSAYTSMASFDPVSVDVFDRVSFGVSADPDGWTVYRGLTIQALGTSAHPVSAWLQLVEQDTGGICGGGGEALAPWLTFIEASGGD